MDDVIVEAVVERPGVGWIVDDDETLATAAVATAELVATDFDNADVVVRGLETAIVVVAELTGDCLDGESLVSLAPDCTAILGEVPG